MRLRVTVEPLSPLLLGSGMDTQNVRETRAYIAGSVLRGAIAERILTRLKAHRNSAGRSPELQADDPRMAGFNEVFVDQPVARFGYLYPGMRTNNGDAPESFPAPATAFACKPHGDKHPLQDALRSLLNGEPRPTECESCRARLDRYRGFSGYHQSIPRRPLLRVGLNRRTETAEDQALYVLDAILPESGREGPLAFTGSLHMREPQWDQLRTLLDRFFLPGERSGSWRLRIGSARARGLGEAILRVHQADTAGLEARFNAFQTIAPQDGRLYVSLTARSPLIVYDQTGAPAMNLLPEVLQSYCGPLPQGLEPQAAIVEAELSSGWSQAWGLPKPVGPIIATGSVFAYSVPSTARTEVLALLQSIEEKALGERLGEGFGDLAVCHPFHVERAAIGQGKGGASLSEEGDEYGT